MDVTDARAVIEDHAVDTPSDHDRKAIEQAIAGRRSVRAYRDDPVSQPLVMHLLDVAARAPSGTNMQPWRAHVVAGVAKTAVTEAIYAEIRAGTTRPDAETYRYYPTEFFEPYLSRRRKVGWDLYSLVGIRKGDVAAMHRQRLENFRFFGAPVGVVFTIDRRLCTGSWLDYGYFLEAFSIAARANGLETCSMAAFAPYTACLRGVLGLGEDEIVVCGMALGKADWAAPINQLCTERVAARAFATFAGFDAE